MAFLKPNSLTLLMSTDQCQFVFTMMGVSFVSVAFFLLIPGGDLN